ncbi:MAG: hypothetical protein WC152_06165 [Candidatus Izemoplasmatales bacterium]
MKKFLSQVLLLFSVILVSLVAVPWNRISQWGFNVSYLTNNELMIKGIIGGFTIVLCILFLFVANRQYRDNGFIKNSTRNLAVIPIFGYAVASISYTAYLAYSIYVGYITSTAQLIFFLGSIGIIISLFIFAYVLIVQYRNVKAIGRVFISIILIEIAIGSAALSYIHLIYRVKDNYSAISTRYMILVVPLFLLIYVIYMIFSSKFERKIIDDNNTGKSESGNFKNKGKNQTPKAQEQERQTMIVSKEQTIISAKEELDPTSIVFEDVQVDPEFSKVSNQANQANSIEYYIEKPKMFKPLSPSFDELVSYVRELPQVVTKLDDDKITFYVDRKPFLVLMNFGNYYRIAFKYDLEQGIRLIIKYPTISKNKSTKDELWFKANNYGDIPKEVIYSIVKTAHNNYNN